MKNNQRKKKYLGTAFQRKLMLLVFFSAVIPAAVVTLCMYYMIFTMLAWQMVFPETIAYNLMPVLGKVNMIIAVALPVVILVIWFIALEISHRAAGPIYRIEKELDERITGQKKGPIITRRKDEFKLLVDKLNKLLAK